MVYMMTDKNGLTPSFPREVQARKFLIDTVYAVPGSYGQDYDLDAIFRGVFARAGRPAMWVLKVSAEQFWQCVADHELGA